MHVSLGVECVVGHTVRNQVLHVLGGALNQHWHLWLVEPPPDDDVITPVATRKPHPDVCEMVWRVTVLALWSRGR
jgi:hypothetical protein